MNIVGLTGAIGHGKSAIANALQHYDSQALHLETNMPIMELANALQNDLISMQVSSSPEFVASWLCNLPIHIDRYMHDTVLPEDVCPTIQDLRENTDQHQKLFTYLETMQANPDLVGATIDADNKETYRPLLQWIGGYMIRRLGLLVWVGEIMERVRDYQANGGTLAIIGGLRSQPEANLVRDAGGVVVYVRRPDTPERDTSDATEVTRKAITHDAMVINNGTLQQLDACALQLLQDIRAGKVQATYDAAHATEPSE
ncbi:hypothetical protein CR970_00675 [Candidatus Saccharibacteria bacterium]|nr:MAG: hypothetical protein CR970_00675 [Candidatus Saccharibacteria bacterium]